MPAEWNDQEVMFEVKVPDEFLLHEKQQVVPMDTAKKQPRHA
jgi:hypothetical protein